MQPISYARHQFPAEVIRHAVWLYLRFTLRYRDVEELLAERGIETSYETVRHWVLKVRAHVRPQPAPAATQAYGHVALGRDSDLDPGSADVLVACRRQRRRGAGAIGPAEAGHSGCPAAHAQAAQEAGLCTGRACER